MALSPILLILFSLLNGCMKNNPNFQPKKYSSDVAVAWMKLNIRLSQITPNFNSVVTDRSMAYAGLTLYESITIESNFNKLKIPALKNASASGKFDKTIFWPASANAAMSVITRDLFGDATTAGLYSIDSLEGYFNEQFKSQANDKEIQGAADYGRSVAAAIFELSKTDGGHEAYLHITDPTYIPPVGDGLWQPTPPLFGPPVFPHWGNNRTFVPDIADLTQPGPPVVYSALLNSPFYNMVNELYTISLSLTHEDSVIAKFWADIPGNLNVPAHATNILTQLIELNHFELDKAALAYAKHGIAMYDASVSVFKTKYHYNLVRPITYIRGVMNHPNWNTVIPTPAHPEYTAAHAVISSASAEVMQAFLGENYHFTDHTYETVFGPRTFDSFDDYAMEAGISRLLGGIHYHPSILKGLDQGRMIGKAVNNLDLNDLQ
jgi:hypothetical protein